MCLASIGGTAGAVRNNADPDVAVGEWSRDCGPPLGLGELRTLMRLCLSTAVDVPSDTDSAAVAVAAASAVKRRADSSNRRAAMLDLIPCLFSACCCAPSAACEEDFERDRLGHAGKALSSGWGEGDEVGTVSVRKGKRRAIDVQAETAGQSAVDSEGVLVRDVQKGYLEPAWSALEEVKSALLDSPWLPELAVPLLKVFEEIEGLLSSLEPVRGWAVQEDDVRAGDFDAVRFIGETQGDGCSLLVREGVWTKVRSRLMECLWMGGMDGADFTGVIRQVCSSRHMPVGLTLLPETCRKAVDVCDGCFDVCVFNRSCLTDNVVVGVGTVREQQWTTRHGLRPTKFTSCSIYHRTLPSTSCPGSCTNSTC